MNERSSPSASGSSNEPGVAPTSNAASHPSDGRGSSRHHATHSMDALADLATRQHRQQSHPQNRLLFRHHESYESQLSPSTLHPSVNRIPRNHSKNRPDAREPVQRSFANTSLSPEDQQRAAQLYAYIRENPHSYESHKQFIQLLHTGLMNHVYPPHQPGAHGDPRTYDLLTDLRAAREDMDRLFAIGENLWADWIQDETLIAQTAEERLAVTELCRRAVDEEYGSVKLWTMFGDWMCYLYEEVSGRYPRSHWTEEDLRIGREIFSWQVVLDIWQQAAEATRWRVHDSHKVWSRFLQLLLDDLARHRTPDRIAHVRSVFESRLQTPHANWDDTFQLFSGFVSTYYNNNYEQIMVSVNARAAEAKAAYRQLEDFENRIQQAVQAGDTVTEVALYTQYIEWQLSRPPRERLYMPYLVNATYQRVLLRDPVNVTLWEDYVTFLIDYTMTHRDQSVDVLPTVKRATRHCPWVGSLWSQYILVAEREGLPFDKIEEIKHKATRTGMLEAGGLEEVIKVHTMWCSYLRRQSFSPDSTEEQLDIAEVGIRSAIESVQELGEKKCGKGFQGDPLFRLERIYIRYFTESGSWDNARETFKSLIDRRGNSYEFWLAYYQWELLSWSRFVHAESSGDSSRRTPSPSYATAVLKQAVQRTDLDWPEKIASTYISHCEDYEDVEELQIAIIETRKMMREVYRRRQAEELARQQQQQQQAEAEAAAAAATSTEVTSSDAAKRKREDEVTDVNGMPAKKARSEEVAAVAMEPAPPKRDREHATVRVKNLPAGVTEARIRQFFRDCGEPKDVRILPDDKDTAIAVVEFESSEDAASALTRDQKPFDGNTIDVELDSGSILWVTNFPPEADEKFIRDLFGKFGEIIDVRFPSLKYNTHRRFCYVQFRTAQETEAATTLDNSAVGENLHLVVKISDPTKKQERHGPVYEGREIHVSNLDWKATENDLKDLFSQYGKVEVARIPTKVSGGSKGFGFVVFSSKEEAQAALAMDQKPFRGRPLQVRLSTPAPVKRQATAILTRRSDSPAAGVNGESGAPDSDIPSGTRAARTLGLMNIPDTVNDARIRALAEQYGPLVKIVLRPDHAGAIVEYADVNDAGKAALKLEGHEIQPGHHIRVGTVTELLKSTAKRRPSGGTSITHKTTQEMLQASGPIKRPTQPGARGVTGRRGGLGMKRGGSLAPVNAPGNETKGENAPHDNINNKTTKSNEDFRAMIQQGSGS